MTLTKEQAESACKYFENAQSHMLPVMQGKLLSIAYRAKCAEVEELRKALISFAEPGHWNVNRNFWTCPDDPIRLARKALEGKE